MVEWVLEGFDVLGLSAPLRELGLPFLRLRIEAYVLDELM